MPELPEVETVRQTLRNKILGSTIEAVDVYCDRIIQNESVDDFKEKLKGKTILDIGRKGKYMYFILSDDTYMISHLRMEGKYFIKPKEDPIVKHEHVIFHFTNGIDLRYHDVRKFGTMELKNKDTLFTSHPLADIGEDATNIDAKMLYQKAKASKTTIKALLLDQSVVSGIGNIYADEILFLSKIKPSRLCFKITKKNCKNIKDNAAIILEKAINAGGTTIRSYTSSLGVTGLFQLELYVHTKEGQPCPICGKTIIKTKVAGRGTYYCPSCQK